ncbi:FtsK/SpoIIIE family DNA translocase [[Clostridium] polysaccharolyticum]|uniref:DNA segregation ATPase FtsK/SpoIIIE, S-DNA-T family n=1 Tax=[Clostridium] polysaccharolyticum TaxID=29364 RepID=A0A1I0AGI1_9FIRM|nr:DNA translocase FtsK [[Clostridium] polysaccharolyticum]SES93404.1 DNA segregation ATPase FtsK/SpoIIIE, S-DNA-T family [[Clostridium] polysaccharolyticum]
MANQKGRKPAARKRKAEKDEGLKPYQDEISIVFTLVLCILLVLSNFHMCGVFGVWVSHLFFGLFGFMNYFLPAGVFIGMAFYLSNKGSRKAKRKLISVFVLMVILMALLQLAYAPYEKGTQIAAYYEASSESRLGGGMVGGFLSGMLCSVFDEIASVVILIGIGLLLCIFITEKLFFAPMGKRGYQKMQEMKEYRRVQREEYERNAFACKEVPVKRKAKTFTIERDPVQKQEKTSGSKPSENAGNGSAGNENGVLQKEKPGRRGKKKTSVDMAEITPSGIPAMNVSQKTAKSEESIPVYEEELKNKFNPVHAKLETDLEEFNSSFAKAIQNSSYLAEGKEETGSNKAVSLEAEKGKEKSAGVFKPAMAVKQKETVVEKASMIEVTPKEAVPDEIAPVSSIEVNPEETALKEMAPESESSDSFGSSRDGKRNSTEAYLEETIPSTITLESSSVETVNYDAVEQEDVPSSSDLERLQSSMEKTVKTAENKPVTEKAEQKKREAERKPDMDMPDIEADKLIEIPYQTPAVDLLKKPKNTGKGMSEKELKETAWKLHQTLESFGVKVTISNISCGPSVTRYELHPEQGVKVSKITNLADDIKLNLAAADVRIEAPIPGKAAVGIEVPNKENTAVMLRELIESSEFQNHSSNIAFAVGKDIAGKTVVSDIAKMPHLLIAGATGSGKSVCINTLIMSILYEAHPDDVKLIMIDPKVVELSVYNGIPHLLVPVVTDPKKASGALNWAVIEMTERYQKFAQLGVRDLKGYNAKVEKTADLNQEQFKKMPQIVIIVDELADLMMVAPGEVEESICRLAQLARAAGIHLVIATQRPSVNVITGVIKANIPSRIAFSVSSAVDSRTIIDSAGAEKLLGKGDMLFYPAGFAKPIRVQGAFVSDQEVSDVVEFLTRDAAATYDNSIVEKISSQAKSSGTSGGGPADDRDEYFVEAAKFIIEKDKASIGMLQRVFKIGFNRASRIMDQLYEAGVVGEEEGTKPRKVVMSMEQLEEYIDEYV